jgi:hypothetical protein
VFLGKHEGGEMTDKLSKRETATLRELANEAWDAELHDELEVLFEDFCRWADNGYSSMEMVERIHQFHQGPNRELYKRYAGMPAVCAVARGIAIGVIDESALPDVLLAKLQDEIEAQRRLNDA